MGTKTINDYNNKAKELNSKYPAVKAKVKEVETYYQNWLEIEVATANQSKALFEMFRGYKFSFRKGI